MRNKKSKKATKNENTYQSLRHDLLRGKLRSGARLVISDLAKKYDVSPMPVREALKRLQQEGLIEVVPHIGAVVTTLDFAKYQEVVEVRNQLEILAAETATEHVNSNVLKRLHSLVSQMGKTLESGATQKNIHLDYKFHFAIYKCSPNKFLVDNVGILWTHCNLSPYILAWDSARAAESHQEHIQILDAIENRDAKLVGTLIRQHKERSLEKLRAVLAGGK